MINKLWKKHQLSQMEAKKAVILIWDHIKLKKSKRQIPMKIKFRSIEGWWPQAAILWPLLSELISQELTAGEEAADGRISSEAARKAAGARWARKVSKRKISRLCKRSQRLKLWTSRMLKTWHSLQILNRTHTLIALNQLLSLICQNLRIKRRWRNLSRCKN